MASNESTQDQPNTLFGHPPGLFTLFFAEMWERFSFYGMRALLVLYMIKGFLGYGDSDAYTVYGFYTALVYMTPFFGGMLADRLLGQRRAVVFGGLLMAAGQCLLTVRYNVAFFGGLALLICGNGFFKPNISTIVGSLYSRGSAKRDGGFTIFYLGINLGAAMSPLLCGYIGETYGWHWGFGLAAIGMLVGLAVFVAPTRATQGLILAGALAAAVSLLVFHPANVLSMLVNVFVAAALLIAAVVSLVALNRGGVPAEAGAPPDPQRLHRRVLGPITAQWAVVLGTVLAVPIFLLLVSGFAPLRADNRAVAIVPDDVIQSMEQSANPLVQVFSVFVKEISRPAGLVLMLSGILAFGYLGLETFRLPKVPRERMYVVLILTFFSVLFWAFFEQAGSSVNNFTDRNVDRVLQARAVAPNEVGQTVVFRIPQDTKEPQLAKLPLLSQEQLGRRNASQAFQAQIEWAVRSVEDKRKKLAPEEIQKLIEGIRKYDVLSLTGLTYLRAAAGADNLPAAQKTVEWVIAPDNVGMGIGGSEIPASAFQATNPVYILLFGLLFSALWTFLGTRGKEPSTTVKFALGLLQLGLGFGAFWYGAHTADARGMVVYYWLLLGYLLHTTGELCLSPVGLAMVTRLSPARLVATVMGAWFLATAFAQLLAAVIAQFTRVSEGVVIPPPVATADIYGGVYGKIAVASLISAAVCFALAPILNRWMHPEQEGEPAAT